MVAALGAGLAPLFTTLCAALKSVLTPLLYVAFAVLGADLARFFHAVVVQLVETVRNFSIITAGELRRIRIMAAKQR